jgi:hypothetical protein
LGAGDRFAVQDASEILRCEVSGERPAMLHATRQNDRELNGYADGVTLLVLTGTN